MTIKQEAIALIEKQRDMEIVMMNNIPEYMSRNDNGYNKLKRRHLRRIEVLDYIFNKIRRY